jgi:elongation of very long chain fatty acids protein 6
MALTMRPLTLDAALEDGLIPHVSARGDQFVQLYQRIPFGKYFYLPFEINYDTSVGVDFTREHNVLPIVIVVAYMACVYFGQKYMATRQRMDLRYKLAGWNAFLCIFSFIGALRTVPDLLYRFGTEPMTSTICTDPVSSWGVGATGLWVQLFIFSKIPELVDTYFIVARQRPLIFLHWYHHVTVLLYCWHSYATEASQALYFVAMNYSVHAIMYGYYCLMALKMKPAWLPPVVITVAQISQMFVGVAVQLAASYKYFTDSSCRVNGANIFWGGLMYSSYFFLFTKFAVERYMKKPQKKVV